MSLPLTVPGPPNAVVAIQGGMAVQAACIISPPAGALLTTTVQPARGNVSVAVQPGMAVKAICLVTSTGAFTSM